MKEQKKDETCYLCQRVTPKQTFQIAHRLWEDKAVAREMAEEATKLVRKIYHTSPTALCGMRSKTIISAILYILGYVKGKPKTQHQFWLKSEIACGTLKNAYLKILPLLDEPIKTKFNAAF